MKSSASKGLFIWRRVTRLTKLLALLGQTSALFIWKRVSRHSYVQYTVVTLGTAKAHALLAKVSPGLPSFPGKAFTW